MIISYAEEIETNLKDTAMFSTGSFFSLAVKNTRIRDEVIYEGVKAAKICWKLINTEINMVYVP